jgi:membrane associated rhomboid family serine protease
MHLFTLNLTLAIIIANVLAFIMGLNNPQIVERMMLITNRVRFFKEWNRTVLSGFAHASPMHIFFNMFTLYSFGPVAEEIYGPIPYILIYIAAIVGGSLFCLLMRWDEHGYAALGASGGLMGVIYSVILVAPSAKLQIFFVPIGIPGWIFGIIFTIVSIILTQLPRAEEARISHEGHLGGAAAGTLVALAFLIHTELEETTWYFVIGGLLPILIFAALKFVAPNLIYRHKRR